jgi:integrase/recombinase XerD
MNIEEKEQVIAFFKEYLYSEEMRLNTVTGYTKGLHLFLDWCSVKELNYREIAYVDLLGYVDYMKELGNTHRTIVGKLGGIRHFYNHLQINDLVKHNPCAELRIKGRINRLPSDLLTWEELEAIYEYYPTASLTGKRNKVIVGLLIYQGLTSGEVERLKIQDIDLERGKVYIEEVSRVNGRVLTLAPVQILHFQKYINQTRRIIQDITEKRDDRLFTTMGGSERFANCIQNLMRYAKAINPKVKNSLQIKASVLTHWLKTHNIREVQYMAGHKYVSSTDRYQTTKLEGLQELINELHPLK